jgi:transcriptional regulator with XRE-family HTH domain
MNVDTYILGENFTAEREVNGLTRAQIAQKLCCSVFQIQQIEEGGKSSFYTDAQKLSTARKMAKLLGMTPEQAFIGNIPKIQPDQKVFDYYENVSHQRRSKLSLGLSGFGLGLFVLAVFGIYSIFSPDFNLYTKNTVQPKELLSREAEINPQSTVEVRPSQEITSQVLANDPCQIPAQQNTTAFTPTRANFVGNFVVFVSNAEQSICVIDGEGQKHSVSLVPNQNKVVNGVGPFTVIGNNLNQIDTYYQGMKVNNLQSNTNTIVLKEATAQLRTDIVKPVVVNQPSISKSPDSSESSIVKSVSNNDNSAVLQNTATSSPSAEPSNTPAE